MEEKERQQSKSSNKQHKRFICERQTLTAQIAAGVWGKPVYFENQQGKVECRQIACSKENTMWEGMEITVSWEPVLLSVVFRQHEMQEQPE